MERGPSIGGLDNLVALRAQTNLQQLADGSFVIDYENSAGRRRHPSYRKREVFHHRALGAAVAVTSSWARLSLEDARSGEFSPTSPRPPGAFVQKTKVWM